MASAEHKLSIFDKLSIFGKYAKKNANIICPWTVSTLPISKSMVKNLQSEIFSL